MPVVAPVAVYRFFDAEGTLLYVGMTESPAARWRQHSANKHWWPEVSAAKVEWHDGHDAAAAAELQAIRTERPRHNIAGALPEGDLPNIPAGHTAAEALIKVGVAAAIEDAAGWAAVDAESALSEAVKDAFAAGASSDEIESAHGHFDVHLSDVRHQAKALAAARRSR